jgi:NhaP-type Na+/H+ or K+/H+ antiporter
VAKTEQEEESRHWKDHLRDKAKENLGFFLEYFTGFVIGVSLSLLGHKFVKFVKKKSLTRKGLLADAWCRSC